MKISLNYRYILPFLLGLVLFGLASCVSDDFVEEGVSGEAVEKKGVLKLEFDLPKYAIPANPKRTTRAMSDEAERAIEVDDLSVLVFDAKGLFLYKAPLKKNTFQFDQSSLNKASVAVEIVKTEDKVNFVVVANHTIEESELKNKITTKVAFLESLIYKMPTAIDGNNIWNAETNASTPFPLYGEKEVLGITEETKSLTIPLLRALARIDIGLDFEIDPEATSGPFSDTANGLDDFTLKDVRVYRTYEEGYVGKIEASGTSVHTDWERRVDDKPLHYILASTSDGKALTREIYLPEAEVVDANLAPTESNNKIHTIVIGGLFDGSEKTTYYKLDFAQDIDKDSRLYQSILRNHRYVFNILNVNSPGFESPELALASASTANIEFEMVHWDESIHEMHVSGKHYFGLDNQELHLPPLMENYKAEDFTLAYQTNMSLDNYPMTFKWGTAAAPKERLDASDNFEATLEGGKIVVKSLADNESNKLYEEILYVKIGSIEIPVKLYQDYFVFSYFLDCGTALVQGTYIVGKPLVADTHYISVTIQPDNENMIGKNYNLYVEEINGIKFNLSGTFENMEAKEVKIPGTGVLESGITDPFLVLIHSNSSTGDFCEVMVSPVMKKVTLMSAGYSDTYGYNLSNVGVPSRVMLETPLNFGPNDDSRVKTEGFEIFDGKTGGNYFTDETIRTYLLGEGRGGEIVDIFHFAYHQGFDQSKDFQMNALMEYLKNGGIFLAFLDDDSGTGGSTTRLMKRIFNQDITVSEKISGSVFPFLCNDYLKPDENASEDEWNAWEELKDKLANDPIMNGPFGDVSNLQWGEDATNPAAITGLDLPSSNFTIYSTGDYLNTKGLQTSKELKEMVTIFKYESDEINMIYIGEGGFTTQKRSNDDMRLKNVPLILDDDTKFPIAKPFDSGYDVYNGTVFGNIMAWAIKKANSPEMMAKKKAYKEQYLIDNPDER